MDPFQADRHYGIIAYRDWSFTLLLLKYQTKGNMPNPEVGTANIIMRKKFVPL